MYEIEKKKYDPPLLIAVRFRIERGFAYSLALSPTGLVDDYGDEMLEERTSRGYFGDNEGWF